MAVFTFPAVQLDTSALATEATQLLNEGHLSAIETDTGSIDTKLTTTNSELSSVNTELDSQTALLTTIDADTGNIATSTSSIDTKLTSTNTKLDSVISNTNRLAPVDQIDSTPLLDTSSSNIPASSSNPLQVVASLAADVHKVVSVEDVGSFIGLYTGVAMSEVLHCVLPLGGGEIEVNLPAGTRISLRNMQNATISSGFISLNFLG